MWYEFAGEIQKNLDDHLHHYKHERTRQGRGMEGGTPCQAFLGDTPEEGVEKEGGKGRCVPQPTTGGSVR